MLEVPDLGSATQLEPLRQIGLDDAQLETLWLLACSEIEPMLPRMAHAIAMPEMPDLSVTLLQQLVEIATGAPLTSAMLDQLVDIGLVETTRDPRLPAHRRWVRATDRVVELVRGEVSLDREVAAIAELVQADEIDARRSELDAALDGDTVVIATGVDEVEPVMALARAAGRRERGTLRVRCADLATTVDALARQARAIARECRLFQVLPLLVGADAMEPATRRVFSTELFARFPEPVLVATRTEPLWETARAVVVHRLVPPAMDERAAIWRAALSTDVPPAVVDEVASRYAIGTGTIRGAAASAMARGTDLDAATIHEGLRAHLDQRLGALARRITCTQTWNDLVLPADQFDQLIELVARVRHRDTVLDRWGFSAKVGRGVGTAVLLSGPPGTGKTMVAGLVASELGLDLYQVDLSRVVSKYIGETEKNLAMIFDAAEAGHAVILFDEADSLFAKRSDVKSSNDRYANLEVNYLLQRIEQFAGIALLTTNHETSLDDALRRRIAIHVRFAIPDEDQREQLWRAMLPDAAPVASEIDFAKLATFAMTGGYIKNAALRAAFLAAAADGPITTALLLRSAQAEYEAMGKIAQR